MGCISSKQNATREDDGRYAAGIGYASDQGAWQSNGGRSVQYKKPKWKSDEPLSLEKITQMRAQFWDTQPFYGGAREIWDALKAACEMDDPETSKLILESAGVIVAAPDMTICYDERGAKYDLPLYVLSNPSNLTS